MLKQVAYYLVFGFFYLVSRLPFFILYGISDILGWFLFAVIRYRRPTVYENVRSSFPEKTEAEVQKIVRQFYFNFTDNWIETIKLISISKQGFLKRVEFVVDEMLAVQKQGKSIQAITGHFFNWEYLNHVLVLSQPNPMLCVYMPVTSSIMERLMQHVRTRFGGVLMPATSLNRDIIKWRKELYLIGLVADQNPPIAQSAYWLWFLGRPTAFVTGPERNAQVLKQVPFFVNITRPRRGHYRMVFEPLLENEADMAIPGEITRRFGKKMEEMIRQSPDLYLWSHRRWKHSWKPEFAENWKDLPELMPKCE